MSKRIDPTSDRVTRNESTKRVRQMTVYDRLQDARKRREAVLAGRTTPMPIPTPNLRASNTPQPPKAQTPPPETAPDPLAARRTRRRRSGYWSSLFQAMAAVLIVAVLVAVFARPDSPAETPVTASALVQPDVTIAPLPPAPATAPTPIASLDPAPTEDTETASAPAAEVAPVVARRAPNAPPAPTIPTFDVAFAPLVAPSFPDRTAAPAPPIPGQPPSELDDFLPFERLVPPVRLTRVPPVRPTRTPTEAPAIATAPTNSFADVTNVVLMVPSFAPQNEAENIVETAAQIGVPVDQTRRAAVSISRTNIRYYHDQDREAAQRLADNLGSQARDFTNFTPPPNPGVIEIWMEGRGGSNTSSQGSATARGLEADLQALRNSIQRALAIATGN